MANKQLTIEELVVQARLIRRLIIQMIAQAGSGHPGGSLSAADLITALYFNVLRFNPGDPQWPDRDRFHMS
ncbi:MAG: transketolase, partial [Candidatus Omnitrophota bacterium]|nr:transketolase [Candidatus Omnitrophota bacterium]